MTHPYRQMRPTNIESEKDNQWCEHCRFRHHPGLDFVAYDGTGCYVADRIASSFNVVINCVRCELVRAGLRRECMQHPETR